MKKIVSTIAALSLFGTVGISAVGIGGAGAINAIAFDGHGHGHSHDEAEANFGDITNVKKGTYTIDPLHAHISFSYNHLGFSYPVLNFTKFDGTLKLDPKKLDETKITVNIDANSIDSRVAVFDGHLKGENFFDVANHPEITFVSTAALPSSTGNGKLAGDLTIKGITKPVVLDVVLHNADKHPISQKDAIGISAKTMVKRSEWDLGAYAPNVSDEVEVTISAELVRQ